jgi:hypothetical protein
MRVGQTPFGITFEIPLASGAEKLSYIIHRGDQKDPGPDQDLVFATNGYEVWQIASADSQRPFLLHTGTSVFLQNNYPDYSFPPPVPAIQLHPSGRLFWTAPRGDSFRPQISENMKSWTDLHPDPIPGTGHSQSFPIFNFLQSPQYFRLVR